MLDGVRVYQRGEEITDYANLLCCIVQEIQGSLPDDEYTFDWSSFSRLRAQRVLDEYDAYVTKLFEQACKGPIEL